MEKIKQHKKTVIIITCAIIILISSLLVFNGLEKNSAKQMKKGDISIEPIILPEIAMTPADNEEIGIFHFEKVGLSVPIVYGYNADFMDQYFDVIGLEAWNNFPGQNNKIYINGHRHLAFQNLKHMVAGDTIKLEMPYGTFTYTVVAEPQIVSANDEAAVDFYHNDHDTEYTPQILRLQTCYPFEAGSTLDHRYLVDLVLTESNYNS